MAQECLRCSSSEYLEPIRLAQVIEKDGKTLYKYDVRCNKCGRVDPYTTENPDLIDPITSLRNSLEQEGLSKIANAGKVNASSDNTGLGEYLSRTKQEIDKELRGE